MAAGDPIPSERFVIGRQLGEGGMGVVYEALDTRLEMRVALKTLRAPVAELLYHFKNEFRSLTDLHHPNLVTLYELFFERGTWFFTMELVEGQNFARFVRGPQPSDGAALAATAISDAPSALGPTTPDLAELPDTIAEAEALTTPVTLASVLERERTFLAWGKRTSALAPKSRRSHRPYDDSRLRRCLAQLASGLSALHDAGKIHRDIKPSNILVTGDGRVVLMDFGLAADAALMEEWAATRRVAGTPEYMAPEQGDPGAVGAAADWYAVGVLLYEILAGRLPHYAETLRALLDAKREPPPPLSSLDLPVRPPADLARLCERLLDPDPAARPDGPAVLELLGIAGAARSGDSGDVFVGRDAELAALRTAYADSRRAAVSVFVQGPSGLGKTALVEQFLGELRAEGAIVLRGRCYAEESVPYKGFDGIIDALTRTLITLGPLRCKELVPETAPLATRIFPVLLRVPLVSEPPPAPEASGVELRSRGFEALADLFGALAAERPLVLFIDDLQWADADSMLLLRELLHPQSAPPLLLLASVRTGAVDPARLAEEARLAPRVIALAPLGPDETRALLAELAPGQGEARRNEIEREAGGHPLFIAELARGELAHSAGLDDALWERAQRLAPDARQAMEVVAVAGAPIDLALVVATTGLPPARCAKLASVLRSERLVKQSPTPDGDVVMEPYHDRIRESVVTRLAPARIAEISAALARALLDAGVGESAPALVVRHLLAAGDVARAVALAERAAERAQASLAFDRAAAFLRTALGAAPADPALTHRLELALAEALAGAGRGAEAADVFLAAGADADDETRLDCRRRAAEQLLAFGHVDRGLAVLEEVMAILGEPVPEGPAAALASLEAGRAGLERPPPPPVFRAEGEIGRDLLRRLDTCQATSIGLILVDNVRGADFQARSLKLALEAREPRRFVRALLLESVYRAQEGEGGRRFARDALAVARDIAEAHPDASVRRWMSAYRVLAEAWLTYYEGRFKRAVALYALADRLFRELPGVAWERNMVLVHRLRATDYQGAWSELRPLYDQYLRDAQRRDDRYVEASIKRWFNVLWLARDQPDLAGEDLDASRWSPPGEGSYHLQHFLELRARVELALYRGDGASQGAWAYPGLDAAERSLLFRIQIARAIGDWLRGRIAACAGDAGRLDEAIGRLEAEKINYASIWAGLLAGSADLLRGDRAGAAARLDATAAISDENDFPLCAAIARLRAAELRGDDGAAAAARAWMRGQDIENPVAMAEVFAPGYR